MRVFEKVTETKTETRSKFVEMRCDICNCVSKNIDWRQDQYAINETTIEHKEGRGYPEGGCHTHYSVDICPSCFQYKLIPWLRSQGAVVKEREVDW